MDLTDSDKLKQMKTPEIWNKFQLICNQFESKNISFEKLERFQFYEHSKNCFAIIRTNENSIYSNIILKKGIIATPNNC